MQTHGRLRHSNDSALPFDGNMAGEDFVRPPSKGAALIDLVSKRAWNGIFRILLFWALTSIALIALSHFVPYANWRYVLDVLKEVARGALGGFPTELLPSLWHQRLFRSQLLSASHFSFVT